MDRLMDAWMHGWTSDRMDEQRGEGPNLVLKNRTALMVGWMAGWRDGSMGQSIISRELAFNFPTIGNLYNETKGTATTVFAKERLPGHALRATVSSQGINSPKTNTSTIDAYPANIQPAIPAAPCDREPCRLLKKYTRLGMGSGIVVPNANQRQTKLPNRHDHQMQVTSESIAILKETLECILYGNK